jgi:hypothetical protein
MKKKKIILNGMSILKILMRTKSYSKIWNNLSTFNWQKMNIVVNILKVNWPIFRIVIVNIF